MSSAFILPEPNLSSSKRDSFGLTRRPFNSSNHHHIHRTNTHPFNDISLTLTRRSRLTNLGVVVLLGIALVSILFNLSYHFSLSRGSRPGFGFGFGSRGRGPKSILLTVGRQTEFKDLNHLIIVPGHAIWNDGDPSRVLDDDEWQLEEYQRGGGRVNAFVAHIKRGYLFFQVTYVN